MRLHDTVAMKRKKRRSKKGRRPMPLPGMPMPLPGMPIPPTPSKKKKPIPKKKKKFKLKKKIKLSLKSKSISGSTEGYNELAGWTSGSNTSIQTTEEVKSIAPEFTKHQCNLCGTVMQVPKAKRATYSIICPHCEHEEKFG